MQSLEWDPHDEINDLIRGDSRALTLSISLTCEDRARRQPGRELSAGTESVSILTSDFLASRNVTSKILLFRLPTLWYPELTKKTLYNEKLLW